MFDRTFSADILFRIVLFCAVTTIALASLCLLGWAADIGALRTPIHEFAPIRPVTALGLLAVGFALLITLLEHSTRRLRYFRTFIGSMLLLLGAYVLTAYALGFTTVTDTFLVPEAHRITSEIGNRMPPQTALGFVFIGISLIFTGFGGRLGRVAALSAFATFVTAYLFTLGILYHSVELFGLPTANSVSIYAVAGFGISSTGLLFANPECRIVGLLSSESLGGHAARRLLPTVVALPTLIGWLRVIGQDAGLYDSGFGSAMSIFILVMLMFAIIVFYSKTIHEADRKRIATEAELVEKEKRYHDLFKYSEGMICTHDLEGTLLSVNPAVTRSMGYESSELIGRNLVDFLPESEKLGFAGFIREIQHSGISNGLLPLTAKNGELIVWRYNSILVTEDDGHEYVIGHAQDVTELIEAQKLLKTLSLTDELTGLYNRRGFMTMAEQQLKLESHAGTARGLTLMFADMDGLKTINDLYGHKAGSEAIVHLAKIVKSALRDADLVARWGGDEFVILSIGSEEKDAELMVDRINSLIEHHNANSLKPYSLSCSIGISPYPLDGSKPLEAIIAEADKAMYAEKRRRKANRESVDTMPDYLPEIAGSPLHTTSGRPIN
jgi:diguanylate cyclase (GGDEF)-like protein/PAS domain S-box-containing protein